ncbi:MAG TPA: flagellar basal body protein [Myxococcota bacterium]
MQIFDDMQTLERSLDVRAQRNEVLASNLANVDTPNFTPQDIDFDDAMQSLTGEVEQKDDASLGVAGFDGNRVDLDKTMAALGENGMQYDAAARVIEKKLAIVRYVASDGQG